MAILKKGDQAPGFMLADQFGKMIKLSDFKGRKLILYFYPKSETFSCIRQIEAVQDAQAKLHDTGVEVLGISPDPTVVQKKISDKFKLKYSLLSDHDHSVADAYGVWNKYTGIIRSTFLVDEDGMILMAWYKVCRKHRPQSDQGCPRHCKRWISSVIGSEQGDMPVPVASPEQ